MLRRLLLLILAPSVALILAVVVLANGARADIAQADGKSHLAELAARSAAVDAALGAETVAAAELQVGEVLDARFTQTDQLLRALGDHAATSETSQGEMTSAIQQVLETLSFRSDIEAGLVSPLQLADRYGTARERLGRAVAIEAVHADPDDRDAAVSALLALIEASRAHVDEHLAVGLAIGYNTWAPGQHSLVAGATERQDANISTATILSGLDIEPPQGLVQLRVELEVDTMLPQVDIAGWNRVSGAWSNELTETIRVYAADVVDTAQIASQEARRTFQITVSLGVVVLVSALGYAVFVSMQLARRIGLITNAAGALAASPSASVKINDQTPDDLGEMARSFDSMADHVRSASNRQHLEARALEAIVRQQPIEDVLSACNEIVKPHGEFVQSNSRDAIIGFRDQTGRHHDLDSGFLHRLAVTRLASDLLRLATSRKRDLEDLHYRASIDALTGLPNREQALLKLEQACREATAADRPAVLFLDLDGFKALNDEHGHASGDKFLQAVSAHITATVNRLGADVGRLGGDEFIVIVSQAGTEAELFELAEQLRECVVATPVPPASRLDVSVGIAVHQQGQGYEQLLSDADEAMYRAKNSLVRIVMSSVDLRNERAEQQHREDFLRRTLRDRDLRAHYQPIWNAEGDQLMALEALARPGSEFGTGGPAPFFETASRLGLAPDFDNLMVAIALDQLSSWSAKGLDVVPVSVNLTAESLNRSTLLDEIQQVLDLTSCPAEWLILEITEDGLIADLRETSGRLRALRELGVRIAIDDFGTGYSSFAYMAEFPFDILKLDRRLITGIDSNTTNRSIVHAIIQLAKILNVSVVAEGVERPEERRLLAEMGCGLVQGFLLAAPEPPQDAGRRLGLLEAVAI